MKRTAKQYSVLALLPLLAACAGPKVTPLDAQIMQYQAMAVSACYAAEFARRQATGYADPRDQALVIMAEALASGGRDRCAAVAGMNVYESRARIAEAQNKAAAGITGNVLTGAIAVTGIVAGAEVLKTAINGAGTTTTVTGDNNSLTRTSTDTTSTATTTQTVSGAGSGATSTSPGSTGPSESTDMSLGEGASATIGQ